MESRDRFFNAANNLTLARLPLAGLIWVSPNKRSYVLGITVAAGITDILDGWVARRMPGGPHPSGEWLDPLCDKIFVISALAAISQKRRPRPLVPLLIASREILQLPLAGFCIAWLGHRGASASRINWKAAHLGKLTTATQFLAMGSMLLRSRWTLPLATLAAAFGSSAAAFYFSRTLPMLKEIQEPVRNKVRAAA